MTRPAQIHLRTAEAGKADVDAVVAAHQSLVPFIVNKYRKSYDDLPEEDLTSWAMYGLWRGAVNVVENGIERDTRMWNGSLYNATLWNMQNFARAARDKRSLRPREFSFHSTYDNGDERSIDAIDQMGVPDPDPESDGVTLWRVAAAALRYNLMWDHLVVFHLVHREEWPRKEVGKYMGLSRERIRQILVEAARAIQDSFFMKRWQGGGGADLVFAEVPDPARLDVVPIPSVDRRGRPRSCGSIHCGRPAVEGGRCGVCSSQGHSVVEAACSQEGCGNVAVEEGLCTTCRDVIYGKDPDWFPMTTAA